MTKYALVTGGSRGIGRAICIRLASMGYHVLINYHNTLQGAEQTLAAVRNAGSNGEMIRFDVTDRGAVDAVLNEWAANHPDAYIEVLVNNAGIRKDNLMLWMEPEEWDSVVNVSLNGFYNITRLLVKNMLIKRFGRIVNIVSLSGIKGMPGQTNYSASKAGGRAHV